LLLRSIDRDYSISTGEEVLMKPYVDKSGEMAKRLDHEVCQYHYTPTRLALNFVCAAVLLVALVIVLWLVLNLQLGGQISPLTELAYYLGILQTLGMYTYVKREEIRSITRVSETRAHNQFKTKLAGLNCCNL